MTHFGPRQRKTHETPQEWLKRGSEITLVSAKWANRGDITTEVGPHGGDRAGAPAMFDPRTAVIEINTDIAFGKKIKPKAIGDLSERRTQFEWPRAMGLTLHETMHAAHTKWDMQAAAKALKPNEQEALMMLEETRIEGFGVRTWPRNRSFLRASANDLILGEFAEKKEEISNTRAAAHLAGLSLARVTAGVLDASDVIAVKDEVDKLIRPETMKQLKAIWSEFQDLSDQQMITNPQRAYDLAIKWNELVHDEAENNGEKDNKDGTPTKIQVMIASGEPGDGGGEDGEPAELTPEQRAMLEALLEDAMATAIDAQSEADQQQKDEKWEEQNAKAAALAKEQNEHKEVASKVFAQGSRPIDAATNSRLIKTRPATGPEHAAAIVIGKLFENAKYHDRVKTIYPSEIPPGRLSTKTVVQDAALRSKGVYLPSTPFKHVQRKHVDDPNLTIGVMVDISGSMSGAMEPMSSAAWILSEAAHRIQAKIAMTYYGNDVFATLRPGQRLPEVNIYSAADGTEKFNRAFMATDGALQLLEGSGARLLVIASDGQYSGGEPEAVRKWLARCQSAGVGVLWLGFGHSTFAEEQCKKFDAVFLPQTGNVTEAARQIGAAGAAALERAGERRNMG